MPRKRPFSAKRKKQQLRERRERKRGDAPAVPGSGERGRLQLGALGPRALARRLRRARREALPARPHGDALELHPERLYGPDLDFPRRPPWSYSLGREELLEREEAAFRAFLRGLPRRGGTATGTTATGTTGTVTRGDNTGDSDSEQDEEEEDDIAPFEHNLETWRQLWRVLEMSDVLLLVADARHPALGVPPALAAHVTGALGKGLLVVLAKADLVPPALVAAWAAELRGRLPHAPVRRPRLRGGWAQAVGPRQLLEACEGLRFRGGVLTLGCVGLPNAGKSSVLNALAGRGLVRVSRAPGRTRYFQTHVLGGGAVRLCDCPGLVFPSRAPPALQAVAGVVPLAQLQEPFTAVGFLAARLPLPELLQLGAPPGGAWTAWGICEAWAEKRGYRTARAARADAHRAATGILRMAAEGRLRLCLRPPGYGARAQYWERHPEAAALAAALERRGPGVRAAPGAASSPEEEGEESGEEGAESAEAPPLGGPAPNPFALLEEGEC
ncbi:guanine nucleotide-binding protein-like 1 [Eudromia elegans]